MLESLVDGGDFLERDLPPTAFARRVVLPVNYTANAAYRAERWSAESEFSQGFQGKNFHCGFEYRPGRLELRGGGRYSRNRWHPSGGLGVNLTPGFGLDVAAYSTSANVERRRDVAVAMSFRFTSR
jgi:hypothetical protein